MHFLETFTPPESRSLPGGKLRNMTFDQLPYSPYSGYFEGAYPDSQTNYDTNNCFADLSSLYLSRTYLEGALAKTTITLNTLRDRQTRNERLLSTCAGPRSKKKKIKQNKWNTGKTIETCEREERAFFDCLQVCIGNIQMLEAIVHSTNTSLVSGHGCSNSNTCSDATSFDWQGWTDNAIVSPFEKEARHTFSIDEIAPEVCREYAISNKVAAEARRVSAQRPSARTPRANRTCVSTVYPVPIDTTFSYNLRSVLSPEATEFQPERPFGLPVHRPGKEVDKLSISGYLASKRLQFAQQRSSSEIGMIDVNHRLSSMARPPLAQLQTWTGPSPQRQPEIEPSPMKVERQRTRSF